MLDRNGLKLSKYLPYSVMMAGVVSTALSTQKAEALTAAEVMDNMNNEQIVGYTAGIVDGLATARWLSDKPDASGMQCIFDWYYQQPNEAVWNNVTN